MYINYKIENSALIWFWSNIMSMLSNVLIMLQPADELSLNLLEEIIIISIFVKNAAIFEIES